MFTWVNYEGRTKEKMKKWKKLKVNIERGLEDNLVNI